MPREMCVVCQAAASQVPKDVRWGHAPSHAACGRGGTRAHGCTTWGHVARGHTGNRRGATRVISMEGGRMEGREKEMKIRMNGKTWRIEMRL
jgi:hypothetical protein